MTVSTSKGAKHAGNISQKAADAYLESIKGGFAGSASGATDIELVRKKFLI